MFFDAVRNNKRVVQIFLALITLPFAFWGVDSYVRSSGAGADLASVGDSKITRAQFDQAWRAQQDRLRQTLGANFRPEMMNTPSAKFAVLDSLIDQRVLLLEAAKGRLAAGDELLREVISKIPTVQDDGRFSMARYQAALAAQGMSQAQFEAQLRQELTLQQLVGAIGETGIVSNSVTDAMLYLQREQRHVVESRFAPEQFAPQVKIEPVAIQKFYDENARSFDIPEQAKVEYVVLSLDALRAQVSVSDGEVAAWYESHQDRFQQPEERRASHILLQTNSETDKEEVKAKAEEILKEVQKAPERFAELAKRYSQDPGSAEKGGDLGYFGRGMMVKEFEDAAFKLKENEFSSVVQSAFGYHIIKLTGVKAGRQRPLADVRAEVEEELKRQSASQRFAEAAEAFSNMVYEQPDSLQPAAERFKLTIQRSDWLLRNPSPAALKALGPLGNEKLLAALFADDSLKNKRNTEAVEIAPNTLLAARVVEYRPASAKPLEAVKAEIEAVLKAQEAGALARKAGEDMLHALQQGADDKLTWAQDGNVSRVDRGQTPAAALKAIFKADVRQLPAYAGAELAGGNYRLYKITAVSHPDKIDESLRTTLLREYNSIIAQEDFAGYLAGLRARYKIDINRTALESKER